jgi:hypothetical protein
MQARWFALGGLATIALGVALAINGSIKATQAEVAMDFNSNVPFSSTLGYNADNAGDYYSAASDADAAHG